MRRTFSALILLLMLSNTGAAGPAGASSATSVSTCPVQNQTPVTMPTLRNMESAPSAILAPPATFSCNQYNQASEGGLVIPTWILALATVGLFFFTYKLWRATSKLADETRRSNESTVRAYIGVDEMESSPERKIELDPPSAMTGILVAHAVANNFGHSPALNVRPAIRLRYMESPPNESDFPPPIYGGGTMLGGGQKLVLRFEEPFDRDRYHLVLTKYAYQSGHGLYAFGCITYFDIFGHKHWTRFCLRVNYRKGPDAAPGWDICGPFNDSDDKPAKS